MATQVQNPQFMDALNKAGQMHQNHYQRLITHLQIE